MFGKMLMARYYAISFTLNKVVILCTSVAFTLVAYFIELLGCLISHVFVRA